jgi:hypothetical protein
MRSTTSQAAPQLKMRSWKRSAKGAYRHQRSDLRALLGAAQGRAAVPVRWSMAVLACRPLSETGARQPRPARYWPDDVPLLAEELLGEEEVLALKEI